jgi:hypothetical protein
LYVKGGESAGGTCDVVIRGGVAGQNNGKTRLWFANDASHSAYIQGEHTGSGNTTLTFGTAIGNVLPAERMVIGTDGCLYINNTNYENASATAGFKLLVSGSDSNGICAKFFHPNRTQGIGIAFDGLAGLSANQNIVMKPSGTGNFQVQGNVGIGHTNPLYKCHIKMSYDNAATGLHLDAGEDNASTNKYTLTIWPYAIGGGEIGWRFRTQNLTGGIHTPLTLNNYGNVVVAGNLNTASLTCNGLITCPVIRPSAGSGDNGIIWPIDPGGGTGDAAWIKYFARTGEACTLELYAGNDADDHIVLKSLAGNVGINTDVPAVKLHVTGEIAATSNITAYYSDERLKTKIANISNPLKIINNLNGFYYTPNELAHKNGIIHTNKEIGLSAQEVQKVLPELVNIAPFDLARDKDGNKVSKSGENYLTISYDRLAPVFVEAIKALQKENNDLKEKYDALQQDMILIKKTLNLI